MFYCGRCGSPTMEGDRFCHRCGAAIGGEGQAAVPVPPPASGAGPPPGAAPASPAGPPPGGTLEEEAARRVKSRMALWNHLGSYAIVNAFLIIVWALTGAGYPWFLWVMAAWGIGVAFHLMGYLLGTRGEPARRRMIERETERMRRARGPAEEEPAPPETPGGAC